MPAHRLPRPPRPGPPRSPPSATGSCTSPPVSPAAPDSYGYASMPPGDGHQRSPPPGNTSAPTSDRNPAPLTNRPRKTHRPQESPPHPATRARPTTPKHQIHCPATKLGIRPSPHQLPRKIEAKVRYRSDRSVRPRRWLAGAPSWTASLGSAASGLTLGTTMLMTQGRIESRPNIRRRQSQKSSPCSFRRA